MRYALVSAAYNEEAFIEGTIRSVVAQTIPPAAWIIVSDGSTDRTDDIVRRYAAQHSFIQFVRRDRTQGRNFGSKVKAVTAGFARLRSMALDIVGNLDADLTFGSTYFEELLEKFCADPALGIGGGWIHEELGGHFEPRPYNAVDSVPHAIQLLRWGCYESIGDYVPLPFGGEDTCAVVTSQMRGWKVRCFPDLTVYHHRRTASAGGMLRNYFRIGRMEYSLGYHPLFQSIKAAARVTERPALVSTALRLTGFWYGYCRREPRLVSGDFVRFLRQQQLARVRGLVGSRARFMSLPRS